MNNVNTERMNKQLTIALVAHDRRKADMVEWAVHNADMLSKHKLICTGTTGGLIKQAFDEKGIDADVTCMNSGPLGGDAEIAALQYELGSLCKTEIHLKDLHKQKLIELQDSWDKLVSLRRHISIFRSHISTKHLRILIQF